jgi:hypothetical protein
MSSTKHQATHTTLSKPASRKRSRQQTDENVSCEAAAGLNEFELARLRRIQHNKQVLVDLGLENAAQSMLAAAGSKHSKQRATRQQRGDGGQQDKQQQQQQPARRSRRLAIQPAEAGSDLQQEFQ